ncbi:PilW family protein [Wenzhouxiangella sp. AB-CW3]|uniref:PilW family protein n=1 Tax=Wenzhouxiangella sp. AB-CW3 TaxID=2771012 RepID=UPI00168A6E33|nr:PilW family protein [Wenzhouxiangella sp. AB-CW3]QOC22787.1 PilW family protein [Wenzhouxiangella sp. AB-CW3]
MRQTLFNRRARGFSLIELLIALILGLLVTGALVQLFLANRLTYSVSDGLVRAQESARYSMERLNRDLRMAGSAPMCSGAPVELNLIIDTSGADGDVADIVNAGGIMLFDYTNTGAGDTYAFPEYGPGNSNNWDHFDGSSLPPALAGRALAGTDVIALRTMEAVTGITGCTGSPPNNPNASALNVCPDDDPGGSVGSANTGVDQGTVVTAVDCTAGVGDIFVNNNNANASAFNRGQGNNHTGVRNRNVNWSHSYRENTEFYRSEVIYYFIGLSAGSTAARPRPALFRVRNCNAANAANCVFEELAEGVENLQVFVRTEGDNTFRDPRDNAIGDWSNVAAVELNLVLVSPEEVDNKDLAQTIDLGNGLNVNVDDRRIRVVYSNTVAVRNRIIVR